MILRTTNYKNVYSALHYGFMPVSIDSNPPAEFQGKVFPDLAPDPFLAKGYSNGTISQELFWELYNKKLDRIDNITSLVSKLSNIAGSQKICLVSLGKPGKFCHRKLLAEWLIKKGFFTKELSVYQGASAKNKNAQLDNQVSSAHLF